MKILYVLLSEGGHFLKENVAMVAIVLMLVKPST